MGKQHVRTTIEPDVHAHLEALAVTRGVSLFVLAREALTEYAAAHPFDGAPAPAQPRTTVTTEEWRDVAGWVKQDPARLTPYTGPRVWGEPANRVLFYNWALTQGYTPTP